MKTITVEILEKVKLSFKWQRNIYFTAGLLLLSGGINILSNNWFFVILGFLSEELLNKPLGALDIILGVILIIVGLYIVRLGIIAIKIQRHDLTKASEFKELAMYEHTRNILNQISNYQFYFSEEDSHLYNIQHFFEKTENLFISRAINKEGKELRDKLNDFLAFRALNFFVYPSNQTQPNPSYHLRPGMEYRKELPNFNQATEDRLELLRIELSGKSQEVDNSLNKLILVFKNKLGLS